MSFLNAEWRKLLIVNYEADPALLTPFVPYRTEPDFWKGKCYISLVGFMFLNTRLLGCPIPFHRHFEEVNLRFYVRSKKGSEWRRGVVFIKEIVPRKALTLVANTVYKEHYETLRMWHRWQQTEGHRVVEYGWTKNRQTHRICAETGLQPVDIATGSKEEFITEHYWGYTKINGNKTTEYEVRHPKWQCYPVVKHAVDVDFGATYGARFATLTTATPASVMLAEGSAISVEAKRVLEE